MHTCGKACGDACRIPAGVTLFDAYERFDFVPCRPVLDGEPEHERSFPAAIGPSFTHGRAIQVQIGLSMLQGSRFIVHKTLSIFGTLTLHTHTDLLSYHLKLFHNS